MINFNYSKFLTEKTFSNPVVLNLANMKINESNDRMVDEDGSIINFNGKEYKNEEVNYVFYNGNNQVLPTNNPVNEIILKEYVSDTLNLELNNNQKQEAQFYPGESADAMKSYMEYFDDIDQPATLTTTHTDENNIVHKYNIGIIARHKLMLGENGIKSIQTNRDILAALGIIPFGSKINNMYGQEYNKAYVSQKQFLNNIKLVANSASELNTDIVYDYYLSNIKDNVDINDSGIPRYKFHTKTTWDDKYYTNFIQKKQTQDPTGNFADYTDDDIHPSVMSVKFAFKQWFDQDFELLNQLDDNFSQYISAYPDSEIKKDWTTDNKVRNLNIMDSEIDKVNTKYLAAITASLIPSAAPIAILTANILSSNLSDMKQARSNINAILNKVVIFEHYTNESIFNNGFFYTQYINNSSWFTQPVNYKIFKYDRIIARAIIAVDMGVKRVKTKSTKGKTKITTNDIGIRFALLNYVDTSFMYSYRKNDTPSGELYNLNIKVNSIENVNDNVLVQLADQLPFTQPLPFSIKFFVNIKGITQKNIEATWINNTSFYIDLDNAIENTTNFGELYSAIVPFSPSQSTDEESEASVSYKIPSLPTDIVLREMALKALQPFTDPNGITIFNDSSKYIQNMAKGMSPSYYNSVAILVKLLQNEFGTSQVDVIDTMRSWDDQESIQTGGDDSNMLSWHNFGYAIRIIIRGIDNQLIKDGTPDYFRLFDIAEAFVKAVYNGKLGDPINVVWCGQLATNPSIFDWEFLPIGVEHRDSWKFRQSLYNQKDPIIENAFVNVTKNKWVIDANSMPTNTPYIYNNSNAYLNAIVINNEYFVDPRYINNYPQIPFDNLPLSNIEQFMFLVQNKQTATGVELNGKKSVTEWKMKNPISFGQLVLFNSFIGGYPTAQALLASDYYNRYYPIVLKYGNSDPIKFCQMILGDEYYNAKLFIKDQGNQSYINISNGLYHSILNDVKSNQPIAQDNMHGQKQIDKNTSEFGIWNDNGTWLSRDNGGFISIVTSEPVITGYISQTNSDGSISYLPTNDGDSGNIHLQMSKQISQSIIEMGDLFKNLNTQFMYDDLLESANKNNIKLLVNEFGIIKTQLVISFEKLRIMYTQLGINGSKKDSTLTVRGVGVNIASGEREQVWEKLVSTSELGGPRKAMLTREKPRIDPLIDKTNLQNAIKGINNLTSPTANDIL